MQEAYSSRAVTIERLLKIRGNALHGSLWANAGVGLLFWLLSSCQLEQARGILELCTSSSFVFCFVLFCFVLVWFGLIWFVFTFSKYLRHRTDPSTCFHIPCVPSLHNLSHKGCFIHPSKGILNLPTSSSPFKQNRWIKIHHQFTSFPKQLGQDSPPRK